MLNDDAHYINSTKPEYINTQPEHIKLQEQVEYYLLSALSIFEVLDQKHSEGLPRTQYYYLKNMYMTVQQLFALYATVYFVQSTAAKNYNEQIMDHLRQTTQSSRETKKDLLHGAVYQLHALCSEGLDTVMLDHLSDRGGNLLINVTTQVQMLQQLLELLSLTFPKTKISAVSDKFC